MTVRVHNLPAGTRDAMVYLRDSDGNCSGRRVERLEEFDLDFQRDPDLFVESFNQIGIEVDGREHRFKFKAQIGGRLDIDFSESRMSQATRTMSNCEKRVVIRYWDGTEAMSGDTVVLDVTQRGVVREVVDTQEKMSRWGLDEYGLMLDNVFYPERFLREHPVDLVSRAA